MNTEVTIQEKTTPKIPVKVATMLCSMAKKSPVKVLISSPERVLEKKPRGNLLIFPIKSFLFSVEWIAPGRNVLKKLNVLTISCNKNKPDIHKAIFRYPLSKILSGFSKCSISRLITK